MKPNDNDKANKPVSENETAAERKKSEERTDQAKKGLHGEEYAEEKFAGSMRSKTGKKDQ